MTPRKKRRIPLSRRLRYALETAAVYAVYGVFRIMPLETASNAGGSLLKKIGPRMGISRVARKNLDRAFPEKTPEEKEKILFGMWENLGRTIAEYPHLRDIAPNIEVAGTEHIHAAKTSGKPAILFSGHLANWEVGAVGVKKNGLSTHLVYRKPNNPGIDGLLRRARDSGAAGHIRKGREGAREIVSVLRDRGAVGMLVDQKLNEGIPIPFFGHDAMTAHAIAHFALRFGCTLYPSRVERLNGTRFRLTILPPLTIKETGDKEADIRRIMTDINALLEGWIRERPEQWLWIHRRWPD